MQAGPASSAASPPLWSSASAGPRQRWQLRRTTTKCIQRLLPASNDNNKLLASAVTRLQDVREASTCPCQVRTLQQPATLAIGLTPMMDWCSIIRRPWALLTYDTLTCVKHCSRHHHHCSRRQRSKSLDMHLRHSTPVRTRRRFCITIARAHTPGPYCTSGGGRISLSSSPKVMGKMWVRLVTARGTGRPQWPPVPGDGWLKDRGLRDLTCAFPRQTSHGSSIVAPLLGNEDMSMPAAANSFRPYRRQASCPARAIFGESGKPLSPGRVVAGYRVETKSYIAE